MRWIWDWAKYHNSRSSKNIRVTKVSFGPNNFPKSTPFWQMNSLVTLILFELWLLWYLAQSQIHCTTLYKYSWEILTRSNLNFSFCDSFKNSDRNYDSCKKAANFDIVFLVNSFIISTLFNEKSRWKIIACLLICICKGQLVSKYLFGVFNSLKKRTWKLKFLP